jgi:hypothetical protein
MQSVRHQHSGVNQGGISSLNKVIGFLYVKVAKNLKDKRESEDKL